MKRFGIALVLLLSLTACTYSTLHYFPAIEGRVTLDGNPLENVVVEYHSTRDFSNFTPEHPAQIEKYKTDKNGNFSIPLYTYTGVVGPHVHRVESRIIIYYENQVYVGLMGVRDYMDNDKIDVSTPLRFSCELSDAPIESQIPELNGDRYWNKNEQEYHYSGVCVYSPQDKR